MQEENSFEANDGRTSKSSRPNYLKVYATFVRNSLVRDMTFRTNFFMEAITSLVWSTMMLGFYWIIFEYANTIGEDTGWGKYEFFVFLATTWIVNALVQGLFMPNAAAFSELIRTGGLDFAMLKPIDTQFLISFRIVSWSSLSNLLLGCGLLAISLNQLATRPEHPWVIHWSIFLLYPFYILLGVAILYSIMITLAATSVWLGRNQSLYDFWFYITNFSRYPMEIYANGWGIILLIVFTFAFPVLVVVNVPARLLAQPLSPPPYWELPLALFTVVAAIGSVFVSRWIFKKSLLSYRSASS